LITFLERRAFALQMAHVFLRRAQLATDLFGGVGVNLDRVLEYAGIEGR